MTQTFFSKINKPLLILSFATVFAIGATKAYFTSFSQSPENVFVSGALEVEIHQDEVLSVSDWQPGETYELNFTIANSGSLPVYVKGFLGGEWLTPELDPSMVEVLSLQREVNGSWVQVTQTGLNIGEEFFLSSDGTENSLESLVPNQEVHYKMNVQLVPEVADEYQLQTFSTSLHIAARQVAQGANWPSEF